MNDTAFFDVIVIGAGHAGAAAAYRLQKEGFHFLLLEKETSPGNSRSTRYDSLVLTHSSRFAELPWLPFGSSSTFFPPRDEFISYLQRYYETFWFPVDYNQTVTHVHKNDTSSVFTITTAEGKEYYTRSIVAASGWCATPLIPDISGISSFSGPKLHTSEYKEPSRYKGKKTVVIGWGLSGLQICYELSSRADVHLITRKPIARIPQYVFSKEIVFRTDLLGIDVSSLNPGKAGVPDDGKYRNAIATGKITHHLWTNYSIQRGILENETHTESLHPEVILFATGYTTTMQYLSSLPWATTNAHEPLHNKGISRADPCLCFLWIPGQRTFSSWNIRWAWRDAQAIVSHLKKQLNKLS